MKRLMDTIQFESRAEVQELMGAIAKYVEQNPKEKDNQILKEFYARLDIMDMEW